jgi:hypothetical protein
MIDVQYRVFNTMYSINKILRKLNTYPILGFDVETRSIYAQEEIVDAKKLLKHPELVIPDKLILLKQIARSSGLSNPRIIRTTHFIFGLGVNDSIILVAHDAKTESAIWNWLIWYQGKLLIHNSGFDLKICYQRTGQFPKDYEDTQLLAKTYINNADVWKAKVGLKELVGDYYDPKWSLFDDYNVKNLNDKKFLDYCAIDGGAVVLLWNQLEEYER